MQKPFRIGVLGSGAGSNFVAIADACKDGRIPGEVALVISDVETAKILERARERNIPAVYLNPGGFRTKLDPVAEAVYIEKLKSANVDLVALAGFMRVIKADMLNAFAERIINIHPSLLPSFPGLAAWKQAFEHGSKVSGCTVHYVDAGVDSGPIIGQRAVPVLDDDTPETLHKRIHAAEHELYPECIAAIAEGRVERRGRRILLRAQQLP